jgi:hypothetical protein
VKKSIPEPPAVTANHRWGTSDVTTRSEHEQQHEQERPAARRGGRGVGASELEGLGIGDGEEAQGTSEGGVTRIRKIRAPCRALGGQCKLLHHAIDYRFPNAAISIALVPQR